MSDTEERPRSQSGVERGRRLALIGLVTCGIVAIFVAAFSAANGGIGWDSSWDTNAALVVRSIDTSLSIDEAYERVPSSSEFYGVLVQQLADVLHAATTGTWRQLQPDEATTYDYQSAVTLILTIAAVTALALAVWLALESFLAAAFGWALTLSTPLWLGMSHVDFKDAPVAAGLTFVTAGLLVCLSGRGGRLAFAGAAVSTATGATVAIAARGGAFALVVGLLGATLAALAVDSLVRRRTGREAQGHLGRVAAVSGSSVAVALGVAWATNPIVRIDLVQWLRDSATIASAFPTIVEVRIAGQDVISTDLPWWYVPAWLGVQLPLLTLAALAATLAAAALRVGRRHSINGGRLLVLTPLLVQGLVFPIAIVARETPLYDGIRHLLFMLPALLQLPAVALAAADRNSRAGTRSRLAIPLVALVVVAASLSASVRWAPYAYAYVNPIAGGDDERLEWDLDYWGVTAREGVTRLRQLGITAIEVRPSNSVGTPWGATGSPDATGPGDTGLYVFRRFDARVDPACTALFEIRRGGRLLGVGGRCPRAG